jgi:archaellum component FlaG (FlaF/FlaG flagellin family)
MLFKINKKGFGDAASALILFIAVLSVSIALVIAFQHYISQAQDSFKTQSDFTVNKLKSGVAITNVYYNSTENNTYIFVRNTGEIDLLTKSFDVYLDNFYMANYSAVDPSDYNKNITLLNSGDTVTFVVNKYLANGTHKVKVVDQYTTYDETYFNN